MKVVEGSRGLCGDSVAWLSQRWQSRESGLTWGGSLSLPDLTHTVARLGVASTHIQDAHPSIQELEAPPRPLQPALLTHKVHHLLNSEKWGRF